VYVLFVIDCKIVPESLSLLRPRLHGIQLGHTHQPRGKTQGGLLLAADYRPSAGRVGLEQDPRPIGLPVGHEVVGLQYP